jgi:hypothetical protein
MSLHLTDAMYVPNIDANNAVRDVFRSFRDSGWSHDGLLGKEDASKISAPT